MIAPEYKTKSADGRGVSQAASGILTQAITGLGDKFILIREDW